MKFPTLIPGWRTLAAREAEVQYAPASARPRRATRSRQQRAVIALTTALLTFLGLNVALGIAAEHSLRLRDPIYGDKEVKLAQHERAAGNTVNRVLMLGTSRTGYGFHARRVEEQLTTALGRPTMAFNFGIPASGPITHKLYLERLLAAGHRPNLLVLEVLPNSLADTSEGPCEQRFITGDRLQRFEVDEAVGYGFPEERARERWQRSVVHPWYTLRFQILGRLANGWLPWHLRQDSSRTSDAHGWLDPVATTVSPERYREAFANARREYADILTTMTPGGGSGRALEDLFVLALEHGITVKVLLMPESPAFRTMYAADVDQRLVAYLSDVCGRHGVQWIDARPWLEEAAFYDGHHLLRPGAEAFSDRLTREVLVPYFAKR